MTKSEIRDKISMYKNQVHNLEEKIRVKKEELKKLYNAEEQHKAKSNSMILKLEREKSNLKNFERIKGIKMVAAYGEDMRNLLSGGSEQNFLDNIKGISNKITKKIEDTEAEITSLRSKINSCEDKISSLRRKLASMD